MKFLFKKIIGLSVIVPLVMGSGLEAFAAGTATGLAKIDYVNEKLIEVATGAKINDASETAAKNWKALTSGFSIATKIGDAEKTIYIGKDLNISTDETGFGTYEDADIQDLKLPARPVAPSAVAYDATADKITGVSTEMEYKIGTGSYQKIEGTTLTRTDFGNFAADITIRTKATATNFASAPKIIKTVALKVDAPEVSYIPAIESLKGMKSTMEYKVEGATKYIAAKDGNLSVSSLLKTDAEVVLEVRLKEVKTTKTVAGSPASEVQKVTLPKKAADATAVVPDFDKEEISVSELQQYSTDKVNWKDGSATKLSLAKIISTKSTTLYIRTKATATVAASTPVSVIIPARPATPAAVYAPATDTITKVTTAMEYLTVGIASAEYTKVPDGAVILTRENMSTATKIKIKVPSTATSFASLEKEVTVPAKSDAKITTVKFNADTEKVEGILSTMEYRIAKEADMETAKWTKAKSGDLDISKLLNANNALEMQVRYAAVPSGKTASEAIKIALPTRGTPVTVAATDIDYDKLTLKLSDTIEYSKDKKVWVKGSDAVDIKDLIGTKALVLNVRTAVVKTGSEVTTLASTITTVTILPRAAKPAVAYSATTDSIKVKDTMQYSVEEDVWVDVPTKTTVLTRTEIDKATTVSIRTKGVANRSIVSEVVEVTVPAVAKITTDVKFDASTEMITGLLSTMEYRITDEDAEATVVAKAKWTTAKSGSLNISKLLSYEKKKNLEVRFKAVGTKPASLPDDKIVIPTRGAKIATIPAVNYTTINLPLVAGQEYSKDKTNWTPAPATGGLDLKDMIGSKGFTLYVRTAAVADTSIASEMVSVAIGAKVAAPKASHDFKTNTIKSVSDKMEYKAPGAAEYTAISGKTIADVVEGTYSIRVKATLKTFASDDTIVNIY